MRRISAVVLCFALLGLAAGCGSTTSSTSTPSQSQSAENSPPASTTPNVRFAKTKFVLHAGLAFGAFHRYIYKPVKQGTFSAAGRGRKTAILVKGGLAALFVYHELKLAATDVKASPTLSKLFSPLTSLADRVKGLAPGLRKGNVSSAEVTQQNAQVATLQSKSAAGGAPAPDLTPPANLATVQ